MMLVILTLIIGFRQSIVPTPWQPYLIAALADFLRRGIREFCHRYRSLAALLI